jgi:hypothetical protein
LSFATKEFFYLVTRELDWNDSGSCVMKYFNISNDKTLVSATDI